MSGKPEEPGLSDKATKSSGTELVVKQPAFLARPGSVSREIEFQSLWFTLARLSWMSLVVVPGDEGGSSAFIATALADIGRRLRVAPVTFLVMAGPIDYASAGRLVASVARPHGPGDNREPSRGRVIVAIPPVLTEPLGIAVTEAADAVVVCIERGRTRMQSVQRTIDMIGRDRIVGCVLV